MLLNYNLTLLRTSCWSSSSLISNMSSAYSVIREKRRSVFGTFLRLEIDSHSLKSFCFYSLFLSYISIPLLMQAEFNSSSVNLSSLSKLIKVSSFLILEKYKLSSLVKILLVKNLITFASRGMLFLNTLIKLLRVFKPVTGFRLMK